MSQITLLATALFHCNLADWSLVFFGRRTLPVFLNRKMTVQSFWHLWLDHFVKKALYSNIQIFPWGRARRKKYHPSILRQWPHLSMITSDLMIMVFTATLATINYRHDYCLNDYQLNDYLILRLNEFCCIEISDINVVKTVSTHSNV